MITNAMRPAERAQRPSIALRITRELKRNYQLYIILLPALLYVLIYHYYPMYGLQIAFRNFVPAKGMLASKWVGLKHFDRFFSSFNCFTLIKNTLTLSLYSLVLGFPFPIILAVSINELTHRHFKKTVQLVSYAPHFISVVALVGMIQILFGNRGIVNAVLTRISGNATDFLGSAPAFVWLYVLSGVWQGAGWGSVIYFSVLSGIDPQMHEAALIDGADKLHRIWYIDIPSIMPTMIVLLILNCGNIMSVGYEKVYLMQNSLNLRTSEVISTYVYKVGLKDAQYSFASAVGMFNSVINLCLLLLVNMISRRFSETSLW